MTHDSGTGDGQVHQHEGIECCSHHEMEIERYLVVYLVGGVLALVGWLAGVFNIADDKIASLPALAGALLLGAPLFWAAILEVKRARFSSSSLAALAILASLVTQQFVTGAFLAFILLVADQILRRTAFGAQRAIEQLVRLTPDVARVVVDGAEQMRPVSEVKVGQIVRVRPGENLPVDGRVVSGRTTINQASLTGEAMPIEAEVGTDVYAGTTNLTGGIDIEVTQVGADTTIGKVSSLIREAESMKSPRQLLIEQVARFYVPVAVSVAALVYYLVAQDPGKQQVAGLTAVTVLVVTCPTALLLSSPSAMVAAFAAAARLGIMVKRPDYIEAAASVDAVVLDKTGTITTGRFGVSRLVPAEGVEGAELLEAAANGEQHSNHPLAQSILATARAARISVDGSDEYEEIHGRGVRARTSLGEIHVGRASWIREINPQAEEAIKQVEAKIEGMSGVHVLRDGRYLGAVGLEDKVRPHARMVVERLRELGVRLISVITGDRLEVARRVALAVGADSVEAECLPEEKHELIRQMVNQGYRVMMVGDGINDGPALAEADVGVAMGLSGSDIAANSAGVALMTDELNRLPFLIELSRRTKSIITQNIAVSILMALIGLLLAATGQFGKLGGVGVGFAALYHFLPDVFVIGNSFRLFRFGEEFLEAEHASRIEAERSRAQRQASIRNLSAAAAG
ncbi:MAG: cation-translocating P-type ATPase [Planctomycetota bacterium]|nr:MAG: cation-translocating P-type ATPase [Planctomycetota bacterium]